MRRFSKSSFLPMGGLIAAIATCLGGVVMARMTSSTASATPALGQSVAVAASRTRTASQPASMAQYVGDAKCTVCHGAQAEAFGKTPHHVAADPRTPAALKGCETCHGPGSLHADDPTKYKVMDFTQAKASDGNAVCLTCHKTGEHALWDGSKHEVRGLSCTTCHSVHNYQSKAFQLKAATETQVCATCHRDKVAKLDRATHMPVTEGTMTCSSCHNPHGSTNVKLLKTGDSVNDMCTSCHADKRGPFLWEHAPVRQGCVNCHDPHGSQNDSMLVAKLPLLCQRCHISTRHPSTLYDATQLTKPQLEDRGCVNCHIMIHGSVHPAGQFFLR